MRRPRPVALAVTALAAGTLVTALATPAGAHSNDRRLNATLTGAAEVPGPGDPNGRGRAFLRVGSNYVCFDLTVRRIGAAEAAHIHEERRGKAGPVVVTLAAPSDGSSSGCARVTRRLARDIADDPADYYVNVHNARYPAGAVRGQLSR